MGLLPSAPPAMPSLLDLAANANGVSWPGGASLFQTGAQQPPSFPAQAPTLLSGSPQSIRTPAAVLGPSMISQQFNALQPMASFKRQLAAAMPSSASTSRNSPGVAARKLGKADPVGEDRLLIAAGAGFTAAYQRDRRRRRVAPRTLPSCAPVGRGRG
jgi:hypothetical protein